MVINTLDRVRKEKITLKQLLLWSHKTHLLRTKTCEFCLRAWRWGPQVGEVTRLGRVTCLSK